MTTKQPWLYMIAWRVDRFGSKKATTAMPDELAHRIEMVKQRFEVSGQFEVWRETFGADDIDDQLLATFQRVGRRWGVEYHPTAYYTNETLT